MPGNRSATAFASLGDPACRQVQVPRPHPPWHGNRWRGEIAAGPLDGSRHARVGTETASPRSARLPLRGHPETPHQVLLAAVRTNPVCCSPQPAPVDRTGRSDSRSAAQLVSDSLPGGCRIRVCQVLFPAPVQFGRLGVSQLESCFSFYFWEALPEGEGKLNPYARGQLQEIGKRRRSHTANSDTPRITVAILCPHVDAPAPPP